jgi:hypothetical protein
MLKFEGYMTFMPATLLSDCDLELDSNAGTDSDEDEYQ